MHLKVIVDCDAIVVEALCPLVHMQVNTVEDFDRNVTIKVFKYSSVEEYYRDATNAWRIAEIKTPMIAMNAADDPINPEYGACVATYVQLHQFLFLCTVYAPHLSVGSLCICHVLS